MGRGSGGRGRRGGSSDFSSQIEFDIFTLRPDGQTPTTFDNAIENFSAFVEQFVGDNFIFDFGGTEIQRTDFDVPVLDLEARFVAAGEQITLNGAPVAASNNYGSPDPNFVPLTAGADRIEYSFVSNTNELAEAANIAEITLFVEDSDPVEPGFQVSAEINGSNSEGEFFTETITIDDLDVDSATSDIEYIVENNIFNVTDRIRISAANADAGDPNEIVSLERGLGPGTGQFTPESPNAADDFATTQADTPVNIDVLSNDNVGSIDAIGSSASGGSIVQNGDLLEYTPAPGFTGQDTFQYTIDNLGEQATATVTVEVTATETPTPPMEPPEPPITPLLDGDDVISGDNCDNVLLGGEGNNILYGFDGDDVLVTGSGADNLQGDNGNDNLSAGGGNDIITGGEGNDIIDAGEGNDTIDAGSQDDSVFGGSGDDLINGGNGNDTLNGGAGNDVLVGDGGSDVFVVNALGGNDTIRDFNFDNDVIGLSDGITFDQITIAQGNGAAILEFNGQLIASISGGTPSQFDAGNFIEV